MGMKSDLAYEIYVRDDGRWLVNSVQRDPGQALLKADQLAESGAFDAVKVVESWQDRQGTAREKEIHLRTDTRKVKDADPVSPVESAPICDSLEALYLLPARLTMGRVLRGYLDAAGITALEALVDFGQIRMLIRNDAVFPKAVSMVVSAQCRQGGDQTERQQFLYDAAEQLLERAREADRDDSALTTLTDHGLAALHDSLAEAERRLGMLRGLAGWMGSAAEGVAKIERLLELVVDDLPPGAALYLDEVLAEILDSPAAFRQVIGRPDDLAGAMIILADLLAGRDIDGAPAILAGLIAFRRRFPLPHLEMVTLSRLQRMVTGLQPLTKDGLQSDMRAFARLVRELEDAVGFVGGVDMAEALTLRARQILERKEPGAAGGAEAIGTVARLTATLGARLGYLIDVSGTETGRDHGDVVVARLAKGMKDIDDPQKLCGSVDAEAGAALLHRLSEKMAAAPLPLAWQEKFSEKLHGMAERYTAGEVTIRAGGKKVAVSLRDLKRKTVKAGAYLFREGETGKEAYLVNSGVLEVVKHGPIGEQRIARISRGAIVGEMALIDDQPRMAGVRVLSEAVLTVIPAEDFQARLDRLAQTDKVLRKLFDVYVERIRKQTRKAVDSPGGPRL